MRESIGELEAALRTLGREPWSHSIKATDDFLEPLFRRYFEKLGLPLTFRKTQYHELAGFIPPDRIDADVIAKLDAISETANRAHPATAP
jgi:hypothetical protein